MKYCEKCIEEFDSNKHTCPICGAVLADVSDNNETVNEYEAADIISGMMTTGIL